MNDTNPVTHDEIARRAHDIWEQRGRPEGHGIDHWLQAERELCGERAQALRIRNSLGSAQPWTAHGASGVAPVISIR